MFRKLVVFAATLIILFGVHLLPAFAGTGDCIVTNSSSRVNINTRYGAGFGYSASGTFSPGESKLADQTFVDDAGHRWYRIEFGKWVMSPPAIASIECALLP